MMTVTYPARTGIYVNMTNRCPCDCAFCLRHNKDHVFDSDSLWLDREPTVSEVCDSIDAWDLTKYDELVFCGYGEPSCRLDTAVSVAKAIKLKHPELKIRINTNGQSDLIMKTDTAPMYEPFDTVSISLNASNAKRYDEICHSVYGQESFEAIKTFAKNVKKYVPSVAFSVVRESLAEDELAECFRIAEECGITLRVRDYISPSEEKSE